MKNASIKILRDIEYKLQTVLEYSLKVVRFKRV